MNRLIIVTLVVAATMFAFLKRKEIVTVFSRSGNADEDGQPADTSAQNEQAKQIPVTEIRELSLERAIGWFQKNMPAVENMPGTYKGIMMRDGDAGNHSELFQKNKSRQSLSNPILLGFINDEKQIAHNLPIIIFSASTVTADLMAQFGDNDLIILT